MMQLLVRAELVLSGWRCVYVNVRLYLMCGDADEANCSSPSNDALAPRVQGLVLLFWTRV